MNKEVRDRQKTARAESDAMQKRKFVRRRYKYLVEHRDKINARRRELYAMKKAAAQEGVQL